MAWGTGSEVRAGARGDQIARLGVSESCPVSPLGTVMRLTLHLHQELCQRPGEGDFGD